MIPTELKQKIEDTITPEDMDSAIDEMMRLESMGKMYLAKNPSVLALQQKTMAYMFAQKRLQAFPVIKRVDYSAPRESDYERQVRIERQNATALMGSDSRYANISVSAFETTKTGVVKFLFDEFHFSGKHNALLLGGAGCGKTYGAVAYVCSSDDFSILFSGEPKNHTFIRAYALSEAIQRKKWDMLDGLRRKKWLVIDDLGVEGAGYKSTDFLSFFEDLFIERHQNQKRTILTCNATIAEVKSTFGDRFVSRLRETGLVFEANDPDMRGIERDARNNNPESNPDSQAVRADNVEGDLQTLPRAES